MPKDWLSLHRDLGKAYPTAAQIRILDCLAENDVLPEDVHKTLGLAQSTVKTQLRRLYRRLGVENWREALTLYHQAADPPSLVDKLDRAETLLRAVLLHPSTNNTQAQPRLLQCLDSLARARRILKAARTGG
jgi:DNA-binding CsgD family transcriptional regulator